MRHADRWDLPKGHSEPGETATETALRETEEETGIAPEMILLDPKFLYQVSYPVQYKRWGNRTFQKTVSYFLGLLSKRVELKLTEHESAQWFAWNPPHQIQQQTIDPLLDAVAKHLESTESSNDQS